MSDSDRFPYAPIKTEADSRRISAPMNLFDYGDSFDDEYRPNGSFSLNQHPGQMLGYTPECYDGSLSSSMMSYIPDTQLEYKVPPFEPSCSSHIPSSHQPTFSDLDAAEASHAVKRRMPEEPTLKRIKTEIKNEEEPTVRSPNSRSNGSDNNDPATTKRHINRVAEIRRRKEQMSYPKNSFLLRCVDLDKPTMDFVWCVDNHQLLLKYVHESLVMNDNEEPVEESDFKKSNVNMRTYVKTDRAELEDVRSKLQERKQVEDEIKRQHQGQDSNDGADNDEASRDAFDDDDEDSNSRL